MNIRETLADWGINAIALAAGFIGSIVALAMNDKQQSYRGAIAQLSCGVAFSGYGSGMFVHLFKMEGSAYIGVMGLVLGLMGMYIGRGLLAIGRNFEADPLGTFITILKNIRSSKKDNSDVDNN